MQTMKKIDGGWSDLAEEGSSNTSTRTCWPRQILGPILKGKKMPGFLARYLLTRSSKNRSGSNSKAE